MGVMKDSREQLLQQILQLSDAQRLSLVAAIIDTLSDPIGADVGQAWDDEIARRLGQIDEGGANMIPGEQVMAKLRELPGGHAA